MDEHTKKLFDELRAMGVKRVVFKGHVVVYEIAEVEFFELAPGIGRLDADTLVPPPAPLDPDATQPHVPRAIANILKKGSVS